MLSHPSLYVAKSIQQINCGSHLVTTEQPEAWRRETGLCNNLLCAGKCYGFREKKICFVKGFVFEVVHFLICALFRRVKFYIALILGRIWN